MTQIKYAAVYRVRDTDRMLLGRGEGEAVQELLQEDEDGEQRLIRADRVDVVDLPETYSPHDYARWAETHHDTILKNYAPMDGETDLNLIRVDEDRAGEELIVRSQRAEHEENKEIDAYVDDDGTVRQESNGAAFNNDVYEVAE